MRTFHRKTLIFLLVLCQTAAYPDKPPSTLLQPNTAAAAYDLDFGDAPENGAFALGFPTTLANNGACHVINPAICLGVHIDGEPDGQPDSTATGDDFSMAYPSGFNDEDGVALPSGAPMGTVVTITVRASVPGYLDAWMDFNLDRTWMDWDEHIFENQYLAAGLNTLTFLIPGTAAPGTSYLRFRFRDYDLPLLADGIAYNGEVEDYQMNILDNSLSGWDFGDAPEGDNLHFYPTLSGNNGARHHVQPGICLGDFVDTEPDGQPDTLSAGDDSDKLYPSMGDDEDGVSLPLSATPGSTFNISVKASVSGYLDGWADYNANGTWSDPGEHIYATLPVNAGINTLSLTIPSTASPGPTYLRFRFRDTNSALSFNGPADNGEVEDYRMQILAVPLNGMDFGDAPQGGNPGNFPTLLNANGARHPIVPGINLGAKVDAEPDGQPSAQSNGDDADLLYPSQGDDEDGVIFPAMIRTGNPAILRVTASVNGYLDGWIDYDGNGTWNASNEHVITGLQISAGVNLITVVIPASAVPGTTHARFRFHTVNTVQSFSGASENGEVEDYMITLLNGNVPLMDFGDAPENPDLQQFTFPVTLARNGAAHIIDPLVHLGITIDAEPDGQPSSAANGDDTDLLYPSGGDDEDGVIVPASMTTGTTVSFTVSTSVSGFLDAWMDVDRDSTWLDPADHIFTQKPLAAGVQTLTWPVLANAVPGISYLRFRFRTDSLPLSYDGWANNGEVEDYMTQVVTNTSTGYDFGDAPAGYPSLLASNGARHAVDWVTFLGSRIDIESDGLPSGSALGDDADNQPDEDGVLFSGNLTPGQNAVVNVIASAGGYLNAWIDFGQDGNWGQATDHIFSDQWLSPGLNILNFNVPGTAVPGMVVGRFRFSTVTGLSYTGAAPNGEVEDHTTLILPSVQNLGDIWMKDTPADPGVEPNPDNGMMWISEDIWVRNADDNLPGNQYPVYHSNCSLSDCNWIYVRVRNRGSGPTPGNEHLRVYWAMAATGLTWPQDWISNGIWGDEVTNTTISFNTNVTVPPIPAGGMILLKIPWCAPDPGNYPLTDPDRLHICLLARIEGNPTDPADHIRFPETGNIPQNVRNNNNIIWRNTNLSDACQPSGVVFLRNNDLIPDIRFVFNTPENGYDSLFFQYGSFNITLEEDVFEEWVAGGSQGEGIIPDTGFVIRIVSPHAWIGGIGTTLYEPSPLRYAFSLQTFPSDTAQDTFNIDMTQVIVFPEQDSLLTGQRFTLNLQGFSQISVTIVPSANPVCSGIPVTYTAMVENGGTSPFFRWSVNGIPVGASQATFTYIPENNDYVQCEVTSSLPCVGGNPANAGFLVSVSSNLVAGTISASQEIPFGSVPEMLTGTPPTGGSEPYSYQWQQSIDQLVFSPIPGATALSYQPGALMVTTYFNMTQSSSDNCMATTNTVTITVNAVVPEVLHVANVVVGAGQFNCYNATQVITVAGQGTTFLVQAEGSATFIAGVNISFLSGTKVLPGGNLHGYISATGPWCSVVKTGETGAGAEIPHSSANKGLREDQPFRLYPNPTQGSFAIACDDPEASVEIRVMISDVIGKPVLSGRWSFAGKVEISLAGRPAGIYFVKIIEGQRTAIYKLIKR